MTTASTSSVNVHMGVCVVKRQSIEARYLNLSFNKQWLQEQRCNQQKKKKKRTLPRRKRVQPSLSPAVFTNQCY